METIAMSKGPGEIAERARQNRARLTMLGSAVFGAATGFAITQVPQLPDGQVSPIAAILITLSYATVVVIASVLFLRRSDEVEVRANNEAAALGLYGYVIFYPSWLFLSKGGLLPEPNHLTVFLITAAIVAVAYFWRKARG